MLLRIKKMLKIKATRVLLVGKMSLEQVLLWSNVFAPIQVCWLLPSLVYNMLNIAIQNMKDCGKLKPGVRLLGRHAAAGAPIALFQCFDVNPSLLVIPKFSLQYVINCSSELRKFCKFKPLRYLFLVGKMSLELSQCCSGPMFRRQFKFVGHYKVYLTLC